ncbi:MAG: AsmA family protein [Alphaproteobacteria bacterium]|nr:AsmA family protein [Alphaproteobacteria bacterium]
MRRALKFMRIGLGLLAGLGISLAAAIYFVDFNEYRETLARHLSAELGQPLRIEGDLKLRLGLHLGFAASRLSLANSAGGTPGEMARVGRVSFGVALRPLFKGDVQIDHLLIEDAEILVERQADGRLNWSSVQDAGRNAIAGPWSPPRIAGLRLLRGKVRYRDGTFGHDLAINELSVLAPDAAAAAAVSLDASLQDRPVTIEGQLTSLEELLHGREIRVHGSMDAAGMRAAIRGRIFHPLEGRGMDIHVSGNSDHIESFRQFVDLPPMVRGKAMISLDLNDRDGPLALRNMAAQIEPAPGVQIALNGKIADALALAGLTLDVEVKAADGGELSVLAGLDLPALSPVWMRGRIVGAMADPVMEDIDLRAGTEDSLLLSATGRVARPLAAQGLDLALRLKGPDSAALTALLGGRMAAPALGEFDLTARLKGAATAPSLSGISGHIRHPDGTDITLLGAIQDPMAGKGLALGITARGPNLRRVAALVGQKIPDLQRFHITADLTGRPQAPVVSGLHLHSQSRQGAKLTLSGKVAEPGEMTGIDLNFEVEGPLGAVLADLMAGPLDPDAMGKISAQTFSAAGRIEGSMTAFGLERLKMRLDDSDIQGRMTVDLRGARPLITADLQSMHLDLDSLPIARETRPGVEKPGTGELLIPDMDIDASALENLDGILKLQARRIQGADVVLQQANIAVELRDGALTLQPSTARLADGQLVLEGKMDDRELALKLELRRAAMSALGPMIDFTMVDGSLDLAAELRGRLDAGIGNLRTLAADLDGEVSVIVTDGHVQSQFLDLLAADLVVALVKAKPLEKRTRLYCFANSHEIKRGVARSQVLMLDTENITIAGEGEVNLADEAIRYRLTPRPKDPSLVSLATPINITGSLANPNARPDNMAVVGSVAAAVVGNLLLPGVGLLLPLLNSGTGEAHPCMHVLKDGKVKAAPAKPGGPKGASGILDRVGGAVSKGAGTLLKLPGKLLGSE